MTDRTRTRKVVLCIGQWLLGVMIILLVLAFFIAMLALDVTVTKGKTSLEW